MNHKLQVQLVQQVFDHLENKSTDTSPNVYRHPVNAYTDPGLLAREWEKLFRNGPQFMGLSCLLPNPGDYLTDDNLGVPGMLVRAANGQLNAFINACRHRGSRVAQGQGTAARSFTCPYHGWTYNTAGELTGLPSRGHFDDIDPSRCALHRLPAHEAFGMMWVDLERDEKPAQTPRSLLGSELSQELENYELSNYHHYQSRQLRLKFNWKLAIDTFLEPYHFAVLHKTTVGPLFLPNLCLFKGFGPHLREVLPRRSINELRDKPQAQWDLLIHSAIVYVLFPNTVFVMLRDHVEIWRAIPDTTDPARCTMLLDFYIPDQVTNDKARQYWDTNMDLTVRTVLEEDFPVSEGAQAGFASGYQAHLLFGRNEPALAHFESQVRQALEPAAQP